jgi:tetratricopeptide (TPR) repeat protein
VAGLCRRLDGLPLAIELAAARVRALPPAELAIRLEDRFRLLAGGARTLDPRQQTLRATIDWSWALLAEGDRRLWRRLSVFSGGWAIPAAEAVCAGDGLEAAEVLEGLVRLVDRSLVVAVGGEPARFRLLESLRAYGAERLADAGEAEAVAARHTAWCLGLAGTGGQGNDEAWLERVRADYDNLRAALDRALAAPDPDTALRLAGALAWYWAADHHDEGRRRIEAALALAPGAPPTPQLARALQSLAVLDVLLRPGPATLDAARRSLELFERFGDRRAAAMSKVILVQAERQGLGGGDAARLLEEAEATFHELGDRWGEAYARSARFATEAYFGEPARAFALAELALEGFQAVGDQRGRAHLLFVLGMAARFGGQLDEAARRYQEALESARPAGPTWVVCSSLVELGSLAALAGEDGRADELHAEAATLARRTGLRRGTAHVSNEMGLVARARGRPEQALPLHRQALAIHRALVPTRVPRTLGQLGCTEARLGQLEAAQAHLREAAGLALATPQPPTAALVLVGFAWVAAGRATPSWPPACSGRPPRPATASGCRPPAPSRRRPHWSPGRPPPTSPRRRSRPPPPPAGPWVPTRPCGSRSADRGSAGRVRQWPPAGEAGVGPVPPLDRRLAQDPAQEVPAAVVQPGREVDQPGVQVAQDDPLGGQRLDRRPQLLVAPRGGRMPVALQQPGRALALAPGLRDQLADPGQGGAHPGQGRVGPLDRPVIGSRHRSFPLLLGPGPGRPRPGGPTGASRTGRRRRSAGTWRRPAGGPARPRPSRARPPGRGRAARARRGGPGGR